jgi:FkbM family methyltransferase
MNLLNDLKKAQELFVRSGLVALGKKTISVIQYRIIKLFYSQIDENELCAQLLMSVRSCGVMFDVGAHYGTALKPFLDSNFKVYAFEPDRKNRDQLSANFQTSIGNLLFIDARAVSDKNSTGIAFYSSGLSSGISGLSAFDASHSQSGSVETVTLQTFCEEKKVTAIDYLKIDTEGFDLNVLKGFDFENICPQVILCEFEDRKTLPLGYRWTDLADFLVSQGYIVLVFEWYPVRRYGAQHRFRELKQYPCLLKSDNAWGNLLAVRSHSSVDFIKSKVKARNRREFE